MSKDFECLKKIIYDTHFDRKKNYLILIFNIWADVEITAVNEVNIMLPCDIWKLVLLEEESLYYNDRQ